MTSKHFSIHFISLNFFFFFFNDTATTEIYTLSLHDALPISGIGSGAFHPLGASNAAAVSNDEHRNAAMSFYTVAGGIGYGLGPIVGSLLLGAFGPRGTLGLLVPGFTAATLIWPQMRLVERAREAKAVATRAMRATSDWGALSRVILVTMLRSCV